MEWLIPAAAALLGAAWIGRGKGYSDGYTRGRDAAIYGRDYRASDAELVSIAASLAAELRRRSHLRDGDESLNLAALGQVLDSQIELARKSGLGE